MFNRQLQETGRWSTSTIWNGSADQTVSAEGYASDPYLGSNLVFRFRNIAPQATAYTHDILCRLLEIVQLVNMYECLI